MEQDISASVKPEAPSELTCWQCGRPADPASPFQIVLQAESIEHLQALDFTVQRRDRLDIVKVPMPCCVQCRTRRPVSVVLIVILTLAGWVMLPLGMLAAGATFAHDWLLMVGVCIVFAALLGGPAYYFRMRAERRIRDYPPFVAMRRQGWRPPPKKKRRLMA